MAHAVHLEPLTADGIERLLTLAVAEATEDDVMAPIDAPPGWPQVRQDAFRDFYRLHQLVMYEVVLNGRTVGMIRLTPSDQDGMAETGMWLGNSARGHGVGAAALRAVLIEAAALGLHSVVAETTPDNTAAIRALTGCGATLRYTTGKVTGEFAF